MTQHNILVLTNRDSDNVGDQLIEATVISLIRAAMGNLGIDDEDVTISSRAAGIISKKYMATKDETLINSARDSIKDADVVIFGGAPLFNYAYQVFYLRTIRTLELAQQYDTPVLFSSTGVEPYSATDPRSQELKQALQLPVVRQITTRDDIESVEKYLENSDIPRALVSDPAVFTKEVFDAVVPDGKPSDNGGKRTIGLVVTRAGIFKDNGVDWDESKQRGFWMDVIKKIEARGDTYKLFTTGHFTDEVFLDSLVREKSIPTDRVKFAVNSPEELLKEINACDGIIAFRLHASIAAFSYKVPAVGLSWNFKVPYFYETVGYGHRAIAPENWQADTVISALDEAMEAGVTHNDEFLYSVYGTLFQGIKGVFAPESTVEAYTVDELREKLPRYKATSYGQYKGKMQRKLRRTYETYKINARKVADFDKEKAKIVAKHEAEIAKLKAQNAKTPTGVRSTAAAFKNALVSAAKRKAGIGK